MVSRKYFFISAAILTLIVMGFLWLNEDEKPANPEPVATPALISNYRDRVIFDKSEEDFLCEFENDLLILKNRLPVPGAAVVIVKGGKIIYEKSFGYKDIGSKSPVTNSTVFRIGSVSKGFASGLAGILVNEGSLSWSAPVNCYLPNYRTSPEEYTDSLTIERILSHTTGYPYQAYSTLIEDNIPLDEMIAALQRLKLSRIPGEIHSYQNVAYSLIEKIIESRVSGSFQDLMAKKIFRPLGMQNASIDFNTIHNELNLALPHFSTSGGFYQSEISTAYYNASAAGGINASISDMGKWLQAIMGYRPAVLPPGVRKQLFTPRIRTAVKNSQLSWLERPRKGHYGLGWRIIEYPSDTLVYHEGYVNGYKSAIGFSPHNDIGICILSNYGGSFTSSLLADFFREEGY